MRIYILYSLILFASLTSCVSDTDEGVIVSDATLFSLAQTVSSFAYYKNNTDTLTTAVESNHPFYVRIRFNTKSLSAMNDSTSNLISPEFPEESMIVKEVYDIKGGSLKRMVVMYKLQHAANNNYGWVWSDLNPDGSVNYSASLKGDQCVACHAEGTNADLVKTFGLH